MDLTDPMYESSGIRNGQNGRNRTESSGAGLQDEKHKEMKGIQVTAQPQNFTGAATPLVKQKKKTLPLTTHPSS